MDHAIEDLKEHARATIEVYDYLPKEELEKEIKPYVDAINILEKHYYLPEYYEENKTTLDSFF